MAVRSKDEILATIKDRIGEDTSDEAIALIEDINDTYDDLDARLSEAGDWKSKYEANDAEWRQKYKERFFNPEVKETVVIEDEVDDEPKNLTYEELFKEE